MWSLRLRPPAPVLGPPSGDKPAPAPAPTPTPTPTPTPPPITTPPITPAPPAITEPTATEEPATEPSDEEDEQATPVEQEEEELVLAGTVVQANSEAESYSLTTGSGQMSAIHATKLPKAGRKLEVPVRELANGTYAEDGRRKVAGKRTSVKIGGLVTFSDPKENQFTVSRRGTSILVRVDPTATPGLEIPELASLITASVRISPRATQLPATPPPETNATPTTTTTTTTTPTTTTTTPTTTTTTDATTTAEAPGPPANCGTPPKPPRPPSTIVTATKVSVGNEFLGYGDFEGIVQGVCESSRDLWLSADSLDEAGEFVIFEVPKEIELGPLDPGQVVNVSAAIEEGTKALELTGVSRDRGIEEADDAALAQGDQAD